ncbi:hypothetical protein [Echinicola vietnamensis]|uniref:Uncharacterized protein n=1 Tax=Echinicola vietnamensis (strain DSM 17526 / LMG 23754 / KMM 6221) TaxID=926556 RepID=L0G0H5_ECHVK|nr:hypothetical protein [Echinicola vietnamensis]AGA78375.1 hypothetical protein Echvi_2124 [Echinicola vietnamensis DSM 17526]
MFTAIVMVGGNEPVYSKQAILCSKNEIASPFLLAMTLEIPLWKKGDAFKIALLGKPLVANEGLLNGPL